MPYRHLAEEKEQPDDAQQQGKSYTDMLGGLQQAAPAASQAASTLPTNGTQAAPGATASGYLNFSDFYNANQGVAQREANKLEKSVGNAAKASQNALNAQQGQFSTGVQRGTFNQAPTALDERSSKQSKALKNEQQHVDEEFYDSRAGTEDYDGSRYLQGESAPIAAPVYGGPQLNYQASGEGLPDYLTQTPKTPEEMAALAAQGYTGPNSLDEGPGYADLLAGAHGADTQLGALAGNPASGDQNLDSGIAALLNPEANGNYTRANETDAALIGAAGRKKFHDLNQIYGTGNALTADVRGANAESKAAADKARQTSEETAGSWKGLLNNYNAANAADDARSKALEEQDKETQGTENRAGDFRRNVVRGNHDIVSHVVRGIGEGLDPVAQVSKATGNKTPEQWANERIDPYFNNMTAGAGVGTNVDSTSYLGWLDDDFGVYDSMTPADWAYFNSLPDDQMDPFNNPKRRWINQRKQQLASQPKKKGGS